MEEIGTVNGRSVGASAEVRSEIAYRAHSIPESAHVVAVAKDAIRSVRLEPVVQVICGGTDACIHNERGIETVVLGTGVRAEHSCDEHILISDTRSAVEIFQQVLSARTKEGIDAGA